MNINHSGSLNYWQKLESYSGLIHRTEKLVNDGFGKADRRRDNRKVKN